MKRAAKYFRNQGSSQIVTVSCLSLGVLMAGVSPAFAAGISCTDSLNARYGFGFNEKSQKYAAFYKKNNSENLRVVSVRFEFSASQKPSDEVTYSKVKIIRFEIDNIMYALKPKAKKLLRTIGGLEMPDLEVHCAVEDAGE